MKQPQNDKNRSLLFRLVTSYSSILLFVLILGLFFMLSLGSTYRSGSYRQNTTLFLNSVKETDTSLRLFSTLATQIGSNETIKSLTYLESDNKTYNFYALGKESMEYLSNLMSMQGMLPINSFYVYLPETEYFLSPSQFASKEMFYFQRTALSEELTARRDALISSYDNVMTLLPFSEYNSTDEPVYLYKIPLSATFSENFHPGIACFELNANILLENFEEVLTGAFSCLYITDKAGTPLITLGNEPNHSTPIESLFKLADNSSSEYHHEEFRQNGKKWNFDKNLSNRYCNSGKFIL